MKQNDTIALSAIIQRNDQKFLSNFLGEEMVMMNLENGDFISMNKVGADIWRFSQHPLPVTDLVKKLLELYDITEEQCINETLDFLETSMGQNMFTINNT